MSKFFEALLSEHFETGLLFIEAPNKKRFIQFRKYVEAGSDGIQFGFPRAPWSERYYEILKKSLNDRGFDYETLTTDQSIVTAFITIDLKRDLARADELAKLVLLDVFKLRPNDGIKLYIRL